MAKEHELKYVALGITTKCSHNCEFCYETAHLRPEARRDGDLRTLFQIGDKLLEAGVEFVELVGGDPSGHPEIGRLTCYLNSLGIKVGLLSNTHHSWLDVAPYVQTLEWTVHGSEEYHDKFTRPGTYREVLSRLKLYADRKREEQQIGITLNFTKVMASEMFEVMQSLKNELPVDYVQLQRIGPFGGAADANYALKLSEVLQIYRQVQRVDEELGIGVEVVDSYPMCLLPEAARKYTARCDWGFGTAYVDMFGNLSRCAVNQRPIGNILNLKTPLKQLWAEHPSLKRFRGKKYLPQLCQECELLERCGGGCPSSCGGCELAADELIVRSR